ncbi:ATP-binding protein [Noviherbaspirillum sp.]|uniref:ATP-binding protein n=1 Tax=Noviherbaspirillum sp. TaxID=1926288 RepID=UPI002FE1B13A
MKSLRARLTVYLLTSALITALIIGYATYQRTLDQNEKLIDYQLRQTALSLRDQGMVDDWSSDVFEEEQHDVVVQIWTESGNVLYLSHPGIALPEKAILGFADAYANGRRWRVYSMVGRSRVIQVAQPYDIRHDLAAGAALRSLMPLIAHMPIMAFLIWLVIGKALKPLRHLEREVTERDARSLDPVTEEGMPTEIAPVAKALNLLLARLKRAFDGQRAFVGDAAHELRSPLTALKLQLRLLATADNEKDKIAAMRSLDDGVDRATRMIEQLLTAARTEYSESTFKEVDVDLVETMRRAIAEMYPLAEARHINISMDAPDHMQMKGDATQLFILMRNLLDNAIRYTPKQGSVEANLHMADNRMCLCIDDSGPGIPADERERVFRRFYRAQSNEEGGNGLGLAIVKNVAIHHHASVKLGDSPLGGLRVLVCFGRHRAASN